MQLLLQTNRIPLDVPSVFSSISIKSDLHLILYVHFDMRYKAIENTADWYRPPEKVK